MAGDAAVDVGHQRDCQRVVGAQGVDGTRFEPAFPRHADAGEGGQHQVVDGVDVVGAFLADPHGRRLLGGTGASLAHRTCARH